MLPHCLSFLTPCPTVLSPLGLSLKGKAFIDTNLLIDFVSSDLARKQSVHEL